MTESVDQQIKGLRERLDLIWNQHEREHAQHEAAHAREHKFAQDAIDKAADLAKENKAAANEWRASMNDREARFSTKDDVKAILGRLDSIERLDLVSAERERQRITEVAEDRIDSERRQSRAQWKVGLLVGFLATTGAVLVNVILRLVGS